MAKKIDIFGSAQEGGKGKGKSDKITVYVDGLEQELLDFDFLKDKEKKNKTKLSQVDDVIRQTAKDEYIKLYQQEKKNPDSFYIKSGKGCIMVVPTDRYITIKEDERVEYLRENYGNDIVTTEEKYIFNNEVLSRNMEVIKKLIASTKEISDTDKMNLLIRETTNTIKKGTIDRLLEYKDRMEIVLDDIQPVIQLKGCGDKAEDGGTAGENLGDEYESQIYKEEDEPKMVRTIFEEEEFEYESGGGVGDKIYKVYGKVYFFGDDGDESQRISMRVNALDGEEAKENAIQEFEMQQGVAVDEYDLSAELISNFESGGGVGLKVSDLKKGDRLKKKGSAFEVDVLEVGNDWRSGHDYALIETPFGNPQSYIDVSNFVFSDGSPKPQYESGGGVGGKSTLIFNLDYEKFLKSKTNEYRKEGYSLMDAIHTALRDLGLELDGKIEKKEFDRVLSKSNPNFKKAWLEYKKDSEIYVKGNYYINPYQLPYYESGGGIEDNFDYGSELTDEAMVKKSLVNGEISCDNLSMILGCTPDYPVQVVGAIKLRKCYLKDSYKVD